MHCVAGFSAVPPLVTSCVTFRFHPGSTRRLGQRRGLRSKNQPRDWADHTDSPAAPSGRWGPGTSLAFRLHAPAWAVAGLAVAWLGAVGSLAARRVHFRPAKFRVPLTPLTPAAAILATTHLIGALLPGGTGARLQPAELPQLADPADALAMRELITIRASHRQPGLASVCALWRLDGAQRGRLLLLQRARRRRAAASGLSHAELRVRSPSLCSKAA